MEYRFWRPVGKGRSLLKIVHKTMIMVISMLFILIVIGNLLFGIFFNKYLLKQEDDQITLMNEGVISYFEEKKLKYIGAVSDWAWWDDAYNYIEQPSPDFEDAYFTDETFINNDINLFMMADINGKAVADLYYDLEHQRFEESPAELLALIEQYMAMYMGNDGETIVVKAGSQYYLIATSLVTSSNGAQEPNGILIFGRAIDEDILEKLGWVIDSEVSITGQEELQIDVLRALVERTGSGYMTKTTRNEAENDLTGHILLNEKDGTLPVILTYTRNRDIFDYGQGQMKDFQILYTAFIIGLIALLVIVIGNIIVRPIRRITREIADLDINNGTVERLESSGKDEIAILGRAINSMLDKIQSEQDLLRRSEKRLLNAQSIAHVGNWEIEIDSDKVWLSEEAMKILGIENKPGYMANSELQKLLRPEDYSILYRTSADIIKGNSCMAIELPFARINDGSSRILKFQAEPEHDINGGLVKVLGVVMDITTEKLKEADIVYLSHHDALTGLYNRFFLEEELNRLETSRQLPLSVIMGDINGLKLINDAFGHSEGDNLLTDTANILRQCSRSEDIIARTGGDEFCILLPSTSAETAQQICRRIYQACSEFNRKNEREFSFVSISLGTGTKTTTEQYMDFIIREAEEAMYKHKLLDRKSMHSSIMTSIKATMAEKSYETQEHGDRLVRLSNRVGRALDLTDDQFNDLELLATLHDIGKIGIDSAILAKEGPLSDDEWAEMKKHPEIGFRIASVSSELAPIAEYILCHHERWDGKGYPQGLAGTDIPILSRIITVVDAFDAMTQDRPYRKAMNKEDAIRELRKNAGTQFDPEIVDVFIKHALGEKIPRAILASKERLVVSQNHAPETAELN